MDPKQVYERRDAVQIVDVREPTEWRAGRIEGAAHIPLRQLPVRATELDPDRPVVAVCRSGARSADATGWLRSRGFDAHNMEGGMIGWSLHRLPFHTPDGRPGEVL